MIWFEGHRQEESTPLPELVNDDKRDKEVRGTMGNFFERVFWGPDQFKAAGDNSAPEKYVHTGTMSTNGHAVEVLAYLLNKRKASSRPLSNVACRKLLNVKWHASNRRRHGE